MVPLVEIPKAATRTHRIGDAVLGFLHAELTVSQVRRVDVPPRTPDQDRLVGIPQWGANTVAVNSRVVVISTAHTDPDPFVGLPTWGTKQ